MSAPVCHIPPANPTVAQPGPKALPSIPNPEPNIQSLLATVQAMKQVIDKITGAALFPTDNGFGRVPDPNKGNKSQWVEQSRQVEKVKVYQNNDPSTGNFVEVERINRLVMADKNTGQTWAWDRERK